MAAVARPPLRRDPARGIAGGVCAGMGRRLGIDPLVLRLMFLVATVAGGFGVLAYAVAWVAMPGDEGTPRWSRRAGIQVAAGSGLLVLAGLLTMRELGLWFSDVLVWPAVLAGGGAALLWRQTRAPRAATPEAVATERVASVYRGGFGVALVIGAGLLFLYYNGALGALRDVILAFVVVALGLSLILAPFLWRLGRNLADERAERIRSQERAEMAAHLHDSVLQTLALVQKRAHDPRTVATLARRQERELRSWLWDAGGAAPEASLAASLRAAAADVEDDHAVPIEVVTVGDAPVDERAAALVAAVREALTNAAKFAGEAGPVALYAEVENGRAHVFVRDRGAGFDPAAVPDDRRGVRDSIVGRMTRHGGRAAVHAAPGGGTEVELVMERDSG